MFPSVLLTFFLALTSATLVAGLSPSDTKLLFYYGPSFEDSVSYELSEATKVLTHPKFTNNETHFYLHGFNENQGYESIHVIVDAYYQRKTLNLLVLDWAVAASGPNYVQAVYNVGQLAPQLADMILDLYAAGLERESFSVVAHSLGAQLAGRTGREIISKTNGAVKLYQMAALDAAFPLFGPFLLQTANSNDVDFLQAIHTDIGIYGQPFAIGHVDFWPNRGWRGQPGCPTGDWLPFSEEDLCSHHRSWRFWAESIADINGPYFWSFPASSYDQFLNEAQNGVQNLEDKAIQMGINCPRDARGKYYLKTNSESPFAKGFEGY